MVFSGKKKMWKKYLVICGFKSEGLNKVQSKSEARGTDIALEMKLDD